MLNGIFDNNRLNTLTLDLKLHYVAEIVFTFLIALQLLGSLSYTLANYLLKNNEISSNLNYNLFSIIFFSGEKTYSRIQTGSPKNPVGPLPVVFSHKNNLCMLHIFRRKKKSKSFLLSFKRLKILFNLFLVQAKKLWRYVRLAFYTGSIAWLICVLLFVFIQLEDYPLLAKLVRFVMRLSSNFIYILLEWFLLRPLGFFIRYALKHFSSWLLLGIR